MMWVEKCDNKVVGGMRVRRRDTRIWFVMMAVFLAAFLFTFLRNNFNSADEVEAANLENFDPGYIISDYQMTRADAMTEEEIQAFLTAKNPCNNTKQGDYEYLTTRYPNLKWHFDDGHFVCLSEELSPSTGKLAKSRPPWAEISPPVTVRDFVPAPSMSPT